MALRGQLLVIYFTCLAAFAVPLINEAPLPRADPSTNAAVGPPCVLTTNGDISGIGVRISFYVQSLIGILAPRFLDLEETGNIFRNSLLTSVALDLSAFIQQGKPGVLSVVDGVLATFLPVLLTIGTSYHIFTLLRSGALVKFSYLIQVVIINIFSLLFWVHVRSFGSFEGCNINTTAQFVLFGHSVSVTSKGLRIFGIVTSALALDPLLVAICIPFGESDDDDDDDSFVEDRGFEIAAWLWTCIPLAAWIYCVVTIEQILHRNGLDVAANQWTYGQTLSVVLLVNTIVDVTVAGVKKKKKKKKGLNATEVAVQTDMKIEHDTKDHANTEVHQVDTIDHSHMK